MLAEDRAELVRLLLRSGCPANEITPRLEALEAAALSFRRRSARRAGSARIAEVVSQLSALVETARQARCTGKASLPERIYPETFEALVGHYPFSNIDVAPVTAEPFANTGPYISPYRVAVVDASIEPHVINAALRQLPSEPHLVAVRSIAFPFEAARTYFYDGLTEPKAEDLRRRLEEFILKCSDVAPDFLQQVRDRVCLATRDPERQNPGRRTLYDWAEPSPEPRLVWEVFEAVLQPATERPEAPIQLAIVPIIDLLTGSAAAGGIRMDIISAMQTIWIATCQHRIVAARLSEMLDGLPGRAELPRHWRRRGFWLACHGAVRDSAAELVRRACMGDHHQVGLLGADPRFFDETSAPAAGRPKNAPKARATGLPVPTLDLAAAASAMTGWQLLRRVARACASRLPHRNAAFSDETHPFANS